MVEACKYINEWTRFLLTPALALNTANTSKGLVTKIAT